MCLRRTLLPLASSLALVLMLGLPTAAPAQGDASSRDATLADIRQELSVLLFEIQRLRRELNTTGGAAETVGGGSLLQRVEAIETELRRLTARTEEMEFRIERIVTDGTNRIGDLEFRLVELEGGDLGSIEATPPLGGEAPQRGLGQPAPADGGDQSGDALMAESERADFDRAVEALDAGENDEAARLFAAFTDTYSGGPLTAEAHFLRGRAHAGLGETSRAARAWLDAFNAAPDGNRAAEALMRLGSALAELGQTEEGCLMLGEVGFRFPDSPLVAQAEEARRALSCP